MGQNGSKFSKQKFLLLFFLRIEWFWVKKKKKKILIIWGSHNPNLRFYVGPPGPKLGIFGTKRFLPVVSLYWPLTFGKKIRKILGADFEKKSKNHEKCDFQNISKCQKWVKMGRNFPNKNFYCFFFCELSDFE